MLRFSVRIRIKNCIKTQSDFPTYNKQTGNNKYLNFRFIFTFIDTMRLYI